MTEARETISNEPSVDDDWESFCEKNNDSCKNNLYNDTLPSFVNNLKSNTSLSIKKNVPGFDESISNKQSSDKQGMDKQSSDKQSSDKQSSDKQRNIYTQDIKDISKNRYEQFIIDEKCNSDKQSSDKQSIRLMTPKCSDIYISTKTQIAYLNQTINLADVFWSIPIIPYHLQEEGLIKKSMKFNTLSQIDLDDNTKRTNQYKYVEQNIILQINNPTGRIQFKDVRKISIGVCKRDILGNREKKNNSAFYNCFVVIVRILQKDVFKEIHVKVFNTGKMEIPGIQSDEMLERVLTVLTTTIRPFIKDSFTPLEYLKEKSEIVLINSNFKCGYYINRVKMYELLKYTYNINCAYDPCSYPGIQCEFYYDTTLSVQTGCQPLYIENNIKKRKEEKKDNTTKIVSNIIKVSFMIFRTGSVLIVGKCNELILNEIYIFIKNILETQYEKIESKEVQLNPPVKSDEKKRKGKMIKIQVERIKTTRTDVIETQLDK